MSHSGGKHISVAVFHKIGINSKIKAKNVFQNQMHKLNRTRCTWWPWSDRGWRMSPSPPVPQIDIRTHNWPSDIIPQVMIYASFQIPRLSDSSIYLGENTQSVLWPRQFITAQKHIQQLVRLQLIRSILSFSDWVFIFEVSLQLKYKKCILMSD